MSVVKTCDKCDAVAGEQTHGWYTFTADILGVDWHYCSLTCAVEGLQGMDGTDREAVPA